MESSVIFFIAELGSVTVLFVLGKLVQLLLNSGKKPYVVRDVNDPSLTGVYIFRIRKYRSGYIEYKFRNENGSWKPVIDKKLINGVAIGVLIMAVIIVCLVGIKDFLLMGLPIALYVAALAVSRYHEAYRILMKN